MVCRGRNFGISGDWFSLIVYLESRDRRNSSRSIRQFQDGHRKQRKARGRRRIAAPASLFSSPSSGYLTIFIGGKKFSSTHSSCLVPSFVANAKRRLSG